MRSVLMIAAVALIAAVLVPRYFTRLNAGHPAPAMMAARPVPAPEPTPTDSRSVIVSRDGRGHFQLNARVDGRRLSFMVDTGASVIALTERDAGRLGYHPGLRDYVAEVRTANGSVRAAPVKLDMVEVGGVMVRNVDAIVMPEEALSENLLGLSFLSRLRRFEYRDGRLVLEE